LRLLIFGILLLTRLTNVSKNKLTYNFMQDHLPSVFFSRLRAYPEVLVICVDQLVVRVD
jgi:hypothetical protein